VNGEGGFSSGKGYFETRNILFIDASDKVAHWLLPDTDHVVAEATDIGEGNNTQPVVGQYNGVRLTKTIAILAYVKPNGEHWRDSLGDLLLSDSTGLHVSKIANEVKDVKSAMLLRNEIVILYERNHRLVLQAFDPTSLAKRREQEIEIPALK